MIFGWKTYFETGRIKLRSNWVNLCCNWNIGMNPCRNAPKCRDKKDISCNVRNSALDSKTSVLSEFNVMAETKKL
jgi:hypothetical protein